MGRPVWKLSWTLRPPAKYIGSMSKEQVNQSAATSSTNRDSDNPTQPKNVEFLDCYLMLNEKMPSERHAFRQMEQQQGEKKDEFNAC